MVCTGDFRYISIIVLTTDQQPVILDQLSVFDKTSGEEFDLCEPDGCADGGSLGAPDMGVYYIFHDHFVGKIGMGDRTLIVEGENADISFQEEFGVRDNGCHIEKTAGPDTVIVHS